MRYIILDIDNCIADDSWRIPRINWSDPDKFRRYHDYHQLAAWDSVLNAGLYWHALDKGQKILIFTSRPVFYCPLTKEWLRRAGVRYMHMLMRNDNDHRPSHEVKAAQLQWLPEYGVKLSEIDCAYDDREQVLEVYRQAGLRTELRAIHSQDAYLHEAKDSA